MHNVNRDKALAQKAMDNLLVDLLIREQAFAAVRVTRITRMAGDRPCWHLWADDNLGVYQLELHDVGQVHCGKSDVAKPSLELQADFIIQYFPFSETVTVAAKLNKFSAQEGVTRLSVGQKSDQKKAPRGTKPNVMRQVATI